MHRGEGEQASPGAHVANIVVPLAQPPDAVKHQQASLRCFMLACPTGLTGFEQKGLCRSDEHPSELPSLMPLSYAVVCVNKKTQRNMTHLISRYNYVCSPPS